MNPDDIEQLADEAAAEDISAKIRESGAEAVEICEVALGNQVEVGDHE